MTISSINSVSAGSQLLASQTMAASSTGSVTTDSTDISPFAAAMAQLQQLQQSDPTQFKSVMSNIADTLTTDTQSASGSTAQMLTDLANKFSQAAQTGQMPDLQPAGQQQVASGHHHHDRVKSYQDSSSTATSTQSQPTTDLAQIIQTALQQSSE